MKYIRFFSCLLIAFLFVSCKDTKEVRNVAKEFFYALNVGDNEKMADLYPQVGNLGTIYESNGTIIESVKWLQEGKYKVVLTNRCPNNIGQIEDITTTLFIQTLNRDNPKDGYYIYDSEGLLVLYSDPSYEFAKRKGYFSGIEHTDQNVAPILNKARLELSEETLRLTDYLRENIVIDWNWSVNYGFATGSGVITNNTKFTIPNLKYVVTFYKRDGTEITKDAGSIFSDLNPADVGSFSFTTDHIGNASRATVTLNFDQDFLIETAAKYDF